MALSSAFSNPVLAEAEQAARATLTIWMRAALRQVALESLRQNVSARSVENPGTPETVDQNIISVSDQAWNSAVNTCLRVAQCWGQELRQVKHRLAATWLDHLVQNELNALFQGSDIQENGTASSGDDSMSASKHPASAAVSDSVQQEEFSDTSTHDAQDMQSFRTVLARLRDIDHDRFLLPSKTRSIPSSDSTKAAIETLDRLGNASSTMPPLARANQCHQEATSDGTDWPFAWKYVQEAADRIPSRLHKNKNTTNIEQRGTCTEEVEVEWIPKSSIDSQHSSTEPVNNDRDNFDGSTTAGFAPTTNTDANPNGALNPNLHHGAQVELDHDPEAVAWLVTRKRKSAGRERKPPKRVRATTGATLEEQEAAIVPRAADTTPSELRWTSEEIQVSLSIQERERLERYIHGHGISGAEVSDEGNPLAAARACILLGPLRVTGQYHAWKQSEVDLPREGNGDAVTSSLTQEQQLRYQRLAIKERLGDHSQGAEYDTGRRVRHSKVIPTSTSNKTSAGDGYQYFDIDMGHSLLEWLHPESGERSLLLFESVECILEDEDEVT